MAGTLVSWTWGSTPLLCLPPVTLVSVRTRSTVERTPDVTGSWGSSYQRVPILRKLCMQAVRWGRRTLHLWNGHFCL